ncbi:hypothetical protein BSL78_04710 [Apostichopus japonicus]|uniref:Uncharacterized protein n=1 Tax=Stichopus japonicus TaxID=307972 RepID=A0A2G8LDS3_STIJA|nr:hypothetical protein BSL78_04710 [Apostichopus japonicus]
MVYLHYYNTTHVQLSVNTASNPRNSLSKYSLETSRAATRKKAKLPTAVHLTSSKEPFQPKPTPRCLRYGVIQFTTCNHNTLLINCLLSNLPIPRNRTSPLRTFVSFDENYFLKEEQEEIVLRVMKIISVFSLSIEPLAEECKTIPMVETRRCRAKSRAERLDDPEPKLVG